MKLERSFLVSFFGNYINNNVLLAIVALLPASATGGMLSVQYISFVVLAAVFVALYSWWIGVRSLKDGAMFGILGFLVAIATAFVSGISGVLAQTGSISQMVSILPNFIPFIWNLTTLVLLGYWLIPAALIGWFRGRGKHSMAAPASSMSMPGSTM